MPEGSRQRGIQHSGNDHSHQLPSSSCGMYGYGTVTSLAPGQERAGADAPPGSNLLFEEVPAVQLRTKREAGCKRILDFAVGLKSNRDGWKGLSRQHSVSYSQSRNLQIPVCH